MAQNQIRNENGSGVTKVPVFKVVPLKIVVLKQRNYHSGRPCVTSYLSRVEYCVVLGPSVPLGSPQKASEPIKLPERSWILDITPLFSAKLCITPHLQPGMLFGREWHLENLVHKTGIPLIHINPHNSTFFHITPHNSTFTLHLICIYHCATLEEAIYSGCIDQELGHVG